MVLHILLGNEATDQSDHSILLGDAATVQISCLEIGLLSRATIMLKDEGTDQTDHLVLLQDVATGK